MSTLNTKLQPHVKYILQKIGVIVSGAITLNSAEIVNKLVQCNNDEKFVLTNYLHPNIIFGDTGDTRFLPVSETLPLIYMGDSILENAPAILV